MTSSPSKKCWKCLAVKRLNEFGLHKGRKDGHRTECKPCTKVLSAKYYAENKEVCIARTTKTHAKWKKNGERVRDWVISKYGGTPCMDCNGVFDWCAMDFDHRPGEVKEMQIGQQGFQRATPERIAKVAKEISKCDLVCANCHRVRTYVTREKHEGK